MVELKTMQNHLKLCQRSSVNVGWSIKRTNIKWAHPRKCYTASASERSKGCSTTGRVSQKQRNTPPRPSEQSLRITA